MTQARAGLPPPPVQFSASLRSPDAQAGLESRRQAKNACYVNTAPCGSSRSLQDAMKKLSLDDQTSNSSVNSTASASRSCESLGRMGSSACASGSGGEKRGTSSSRYVLSPSSSPGQQEDEVEDTQELETYIEPVVEPRGRKKASGPTTRRMRVKFDWNDGQKKHLTAHRGDVLLFLKPSRSHYGWAKMRSAEGVEGLFPTEYVEPEEQVDHPEAHAAFMANVDRRTAERLLLYPGGEIGAFLVREHKADEHRRGRKKEELRENEANEKEKDEEPGGRHQWTLSVLQQIAKESSRQKTRCVRHYSILFDPKKHEYSVANITRSRFQVLDFERRTCPTRSPVFRE